MNTERKDYIYSILRNDFDDNEWHLEFASLKAKMCINCVIDLGFIDAAKEMISDAKEYGYDYTNLLN